jgi:hypothetical protein
MKGTVLKNLCPQAVVVQAFSTIPLSDNYFLVSLSILGNDYKIIWTIPTLLRLYIVRAKKNWVNIKSEIDFEYEMFSWSKIRDLSSFVSKTLVSW